MTQNGASPQCVPLAGWRVQTGGGLVEFVIMAPTLLALSLAMLQTGLVFHAKSSLNYATFEAARAGALTHASQVSMQRAVTRALVPLPLLEGSVEAVRGGVLVAASGMRGMPGGVTGN